MRRQRLLVLNQYYWPGVEATGNLLTELCEALAADFDVTVIAGGAEGVPVRQVRNGVEILRVRSTSYDRSRLSRRALNYLTYVIGVGWRAMFRRRPDLVVCMTDPPFIGALARVVAVRFRAPLLVIAQDVFPEIAVKLGRLRNPLVIRVLGLLVNSSLRSADRVVAIGDTMKRRLEEKGVPSDRIRVIPNWVDVETVWPAPRNNPWAREHRLAKRFVVMHSGNVGHAQDLDALIRACMFLRDLDDLAVRIIGGGARRDELIELARLLEVDMVGFMPWQPHGLRSLSFSTADVHVVGLARGLAGYVVPSRLYGILATGRPVIAAAEPESETAQLVREIGCGVVVPPGNPFALARAIRAAHDGEYDLAAMGARAREFAMSEGDRPVAIRRYAEVLAELQGAA
ncbi:MAG TPA: glycosyltransferase family 4 protein [Gaiellaceae bacterium]|nr:glycosyltransferase family 4 protein [Gaiellaceae bacterium]